MYFISYEQRGMENAYAKQVRTVILLVCLLAGFDVADFRLALQWLCDDVYTFQELKFMFSHYFWQAVWKTSDKTINGLDLQ